MNFVLGENSLFHSWTFLSVGTESWSFGTNYCFAVNTSGTGLVVLVNNSIGSFGFMVNSSLVMMCDGSALGLIMTNYYLTAINMINVFKS